ncbi:ATP-binding protein [Kitasatospora sp. NBC_00240]|uniref:ATP-binding protein n=1 Tax=Kitasatospora sp. NBC_00240 TaxID=2903567 RepID=UPI002258248C|nr:ATP-binding protein [Kitasatospora sp. NBC_00240]MCX5212581.1 ATP-binding protein [Kitasatospora sp. NBC_00240]
MPQNRFRLPASESSVAVARRLAVAQLGTWVGELDPDDRAVIELLVSELVTNAVRYGKTQTTTVELIGTEDGTVVLTVEDANPTEPQQQEPEADDEGGRGLLLVDALALQRGTIRLDSGKKTWVEVRMAPGTAARLRALAVPRPAANSLPDLADRLPSQLLDHRIRALRPRPGVGDLDGHRPPLGRHRCRARAAEATTVGGRP